MLQKKEGTSFHKPKLFLKGMVLGQGHNRPLGPSVASLSSLHAHIQQNRFDFLKVITESCLPLLTSFVVFKALLHLRSYNFSIRSKFSNPLRPFVQFNTCWQKGLQIDILSYFCRYSINLLTSFLIETLCRKDICEIFSIDSFILFK